MSMRTGLMLLWMAGYACIILVQGWSHTPIGSTRRVFDCNIHVVRGASRFVGRRPSAVSPVIFGMHIGFTEGPEHLTLVDFGGTLKLIILPFSCFVRTVPLLSKCHFRPWMTPTLSLMQL